MIKKFRKIPVEVEAIQLFEHNMTEILNWCNSILTNDCKSFFTSDHKAIFVYTKEGLMVCSIGDYMLKEPFPTGDRDFYPCKPDIFEKTYEEVK